MNLFRTNNEYIDLTFGSIFIFISIFATLAYVKKKFILFEC